MLRSAAHDALKCGAHSQVDVQAGVEQIAVARVADDQPTLAVVADETFGDAFDRLREPLLAAQPRNEGKPPAAVIVSQALASKLFPQGEALGKSIYLASQKQKTPIVGIVDRLQEPWVSAGNRYSENAMLQPYRYVEQYSHYIVRARPGHLDAVIKDTQKQLLGLSRARILQRTRTMTESR